MDGGCGGGKRILGKGQGSMGDRKSFTLISLYLGKHSNHNLPLPSSRVITLPSSFKESSSR
ncbi:hypothetical protein EL17_18895 [Anditalea andensis]|uniref:Uncharacterized protein n=1 Tax=Anditalea andensis TaxID=1048983 RepID=A0A074KTJ5_9BACT|nr:hypothetical protein EL17_18895 [Anditalea andensis]